MKLITDLTEEVAYITEANQAGGKDLYLHGTFMQSEIKNKNGRMYPRAVMEREINRYRTDFIGRNRGYGELGHPNGPKINEDRISHMTTMLESEGNNWVGKAKLLNTPMGNIARGIMESGGQLGVSSRALGSLKADKSGTMIVQEDFRLFTPADIVTDPSGPDCFVNGIMENVEWFQHPTLGWQTCEVIHEARKIAHVTWKTLNESDKLSIFNRVLASVGRP